MGDKAKNFNNLDEDAAGYKILFISLYFEPLVAHAEDHGTV